MPDAWIVVLLHQFFFQGMFVIKNVALWRKTKKQIRGKNREARTFIVFFTLFLIAVLVLCFLPSPPGKIGVLADLTALVAALILMLLGLAIALASLLHLRDSWRVGVLEDQKTELISSGIYRFTRNPYFVSYLLMFAAHTILLQNLIVLASSALGFFLVHQMIRKEESSLLSVHADAYRRYQQRVPRYLIL